MTREQIRDLWMAGHLDGWLLVEHEMDRLTAELAESRRATESVQAHALAKDGTHRAALAVAHTDVLKLNEKSARLKTANRRLCGQQVQLVKALRALLRLLCSEKYAEVQRQFGAEVFGAIRQADEVCRLCEVPFGG